MPDLTPCTEQCDHGLSCEYNEPGHREHHRWNPDEDRLHEWVSGDWCVPTAIEEPAR